MDAEEAINGRTRQLEAYEHSKKRKFYVKGGSKSITFVRRKVGPESNYQRILLARKRVRKSDRKMPHEPIGGDILIKEFGKLKDPLGTDFYRAAAIIVEASLGSVANKHMRELEGLLIPWKREFGFNRHNGLHYDRAGLQPIAKGEKLRLFKQRAAEANAIRTPEFLRKRYRLLSLYNAIAAEMRFRGIWHRVNMDTD